MANIQTGNQKVQATASQADAGDYIEITVYEAKKWFRTLLELPRHTTNHGAT